MIRRRGRSPTKHLGTNTAEASDALEFLDTDDQDALVESLAYESKAQAQQFQKLFGLVGLFAIFVSLGYPFLCQEECSVRAFSCWFHVLSSCGTHGLSIWLSRVDLEALWSTEETGRVQMFPPIATLFGILVNLVPIVFWVGGIFHADVEHFHVGLGLGNVVTFTGSLLLRWDAVSTYAALEDLDGAKYEHKSL